MSIIDPTSQNIFKSADVVFAKVKRFLSSLMDTNVIDEGEFPVYVYELERALGIGVYKEMDAVIKITNFKGCLPRDFAQLYAAYKCTETLDFGGREHVQGRPISLFSDITQEILSSSDTCQILTTTAQSEYARDNVNVFEHITVRQVVKENTVTLNFKNPVLLRLSPNVKKDRCATDCQNTMASHSPYEITLGDGTLYTNFTNDSVYMKYYALPLDENGVPMIQDEEFLEKTIEWYIIYQVLLQLWFNNQAPDIEKKMAFAKNEYELALAQRKYYQKLPAFAQMCNTIRRNRAVNKIQIWAR